VETRLVLPLVTNAQENDDVLKSLIDGWLVPRLVDEYIRERQLALSEPVEPIENDENGEKCRAA
jgi:hypothetical protein